MTIRPDPTFHATAKLAMEATPERYAYCLMLSPDFSRPDGLAIVDLDPKSSHCSNIVHTVIGGSLLDDPDVIAEGSIAAAVMGF